METKNTRPIFPWYKERLQNKYLKVPTDKLSSVNSCWCFVNMRSLDGLNESSPSLPGAQRGASLVIFDSTSNHTSNQMSQKRISKTHACFSKQMIRKQIRREYVASLEEKLTQHPLALYPHYKDHMSPELFDKVASVLDPDMCVNSSSALPTPVLGQGGGGRGNLHGAKEGEDRAKQESSASKISTDVQNPSSRNLYVPQIKVNGTMKGQTDKGHLSSHEDIEVAAKLFSNKFASKDKETNSESTILGHFDSGLQDSSSTTFSIQKNANSFSSQE